MNGCGLMEGQVKCHETGYAKLSENLIVFKKCVFLK